MTKIDPTPLIAEAQARETALKVALDRLERAERRAATYLAFALAFAALYIVRWLLS